MTFDPPAPIREHAGRRMKTAISCKGRQSRGFSATALIASLAIFTPNALEARTTRAPLLTWPDLTKRPRPTPDQTILYGSDAMHRVDLWLPAGPGLHPVVLMVHGGCWQTKIADRRLMDWIAADLRAAGVAVWNIDYRGVDRLGGGYPGTFADVGQAADALRTHAAGHRLDATRVVAVGHSAGGHLALWLAARPKLPADSALRAADPLRVASVVSLGGLPDLRATARARDNGCGTAVIRKLVGTGRADPYADTSIPRLLPIGVPQHLVNGREDRIIPFRMGTNYRARARAAGDRVALYLPPRTGHVELIAPESAAWATAKRIILKELGR